MKAVIPCAKKEESLYPFTESKPTGMIPVMGKPIVKHLISDLQEEGVDDIYIVANYREENFREEFEEYTNVNVVTQEELNGTGGAVETCDFIQEDFAVINGDVVTSSQDISALLEKHRENKSDATVLADTEESPEKFGVLSIKNDRVESITEKPEDPENTLVNTGMYVFSPEIFDILEEMEGEKDLTDAVQKMVENHEVRFEMVENYWIDIGSNRKLWKADRAKRENEITKTEIHKDAEVHEEAEIEGKAVVEKNAEIKAGTVIEGKTFIGESSVIGSNTSVRSSTVSRGSQIRSCSIDTSLLFEKNIVDPFTHVESCVLAEEADIKSNTAIRESFIGPRSFVEMNNSIYGVKFVPDARTDLGEISK
ncbi:MAG: NDP-sugar pyrophosphorylase family protein [Candidatus Nanohaloarchaea archaeon]|jgi:NDP-sugar pyrophosphorylase family protein